MFFMLPETENRTMQDIELHFNENKRSIFDINIHINASINSNTTEVENKTDKQRF